MSAETLHRRACLLPWQSLMVASDGSIRPCCNSLRALSRGKADHGSAFWNSSATLSLRRELLIDDLDESCSICKSQNIEPPEEVVPDIYMGQTIVCEQVVNTPRDTLPAGPPHSQVYQQWPRSCVGFADGATPASRNRRLDLLVEFCTDEQRPELFFLRDIGGKINVSAFGVPVAAGKCLVSFEVKTERQESVRDLQLIVKLPGGRYLSVPWKVEEKISLRGATLYKGSNTYPVISHNMPGSAILGHFDECYFEGTALRCKGWAFHRQLGMAPDTILLFGIGQTLLAASCPKGERYDVAEALSAPTAVKSGFFFSLDRELGLAKTSIVGVTAIALFSQARCAFLIGTTRPR